MIVQLLDMSLLHVWTPLRPTPSFLSANHADRRKPLKRVHLKMDAFLGPLPPSPEKWKGLCSPQAPSTVFGTGEVVMVSL